MEADVVGDFWVYPLRWGETLSNHDWVPLRINRLLTSRFLAHAFAEGRRDDIATALVLWCESYKQDPAGTLPDDDVQLAQLARFGGDVDGWRAARTGALYGWRSVSIDGDDMHRDPRLGHPVIAEIAADMFRRKRGRDASREAGRFATMRSRVRIRIAKLGYPKAHAESDQVVGLVASWLDQNGLFVTDDNVRQAMEFAAGIPRSVTPIRGRREV